MPENNSKLHINVKKTKLLVTGNTPKSDDNITLDGETVEEVDKFKYLGSVPVTSRRE